MSAGQGKRASIEYAEAVESLSETSEKDGWGLRARHNLVSHIEGAADDLKQIYDDMARDLGYSGAARSDGEGKLLEELLS